MTGHRPACVILGGPNGAGKSTIYKNLGLAGVFINADDVARSLSPSDPAASALRAGRLVVQRLAELINTRQDFIYETTLSSHQSVNLLRNASKAGHETLLIFVALATPELHVQRVAQRVSRGGHNIPEAIIRRRYDIAFNNLSVCMAISDATLIFDNSSLGARLIFETDNQRIRQSHVDPRNPLDRRIAACVAAGLDLPLDSILLPAKPSASPKASRSTIP